MKVREVDGHGHEATHYYAYEDEAGLAHVEAVHWWIDQREDFKVGVVYAVDKGCIYIDKQYLRDELDADLFG